MHTGSASLLDHPFSYQQISELRYQILLLLSLSMISVSFGLQSLEIRPQCQDSVCDLRFLRQQLSRTPLLMSLQRQSLPILTLSLLIFLRM
jgi:hypothetical protein